MRLYDTTTDRRTYKICRWKDLKLGPFEYDPLHRYDHFWRHSDDDDTKGKYRTRYPNWKLVSKNKKQWMKKPLKLKHVYYSPWDQTDTWRLTW